MNQQLEYLKSEITELKNQMQLEIRTNRRGEFEHGKYEAYLQVLLLIIDLQLQRDWGVENDTCTTGVGS